MLKMHMQQTIGLVLLLLQTCASDNYLAVSKLHRVDQKIGNTIHFDTQSGMTVLVTQTEKQLSFAFCSLQFCREDDTQRRTLFLV